MAVVLVVLAIAFALVLGKNDLAERGVKVLIGLVLILSFLPGVIARTGGVEAGCSSRGIAVDALGDVLLVVALAGIGLAAWRLRSVFAKRREDAARKWASPRERALPPAPDRRVDEDRR